MKRVIMLEIEALDDEEVWGLLGEGSRPVVKMTMSAETTMAVRTAWEQIP